MVKKETSQLPVRIYRSENQFALAAPLPGLEASDITVTIEGRRVTIQGNERGPRQHDLDLLNEEWSIGPYYREVELPEKVDGALANATYGNGVLVLTMPKVKSSGKTARAEFTLEVIDGARGERIGHMGHDIVKTTTKQHLARLAEISGKDGHVGLRT
jgi:HSP20 family protein